MNKNKKNKRYTQVELKSNKCPYKLEESINDFLKKLGDVKVQIQYQATVSSFEALIIYEVEE